MKKIVSAMLAATMAFGLAACGSTADTTASSAASDTSVVASSETGSSDAAATGTAIKLGGIGPVTGGAAVYGMAVRNGAQLAVEEINAAQGTTVFELQFEDDEHDAEKSVNAYNTLKDWGMQALVGPVTSTPALAVAAEAVNDNLFMLTPSASAEDVATAGANVYQMCFTDPNQGVVSANYIVDNALGTKIGVIYDASDAYSTGIYSAFQAEAAAKGLEIVTAESFTADNKSDLSTQVAKCRDAGADLVFLPIYYTETTQILTAASRIGYAPTFFGCDGMDGILDVEGFDTTMAEGLMMLCPFSAFGTDETTQNFVAAYQAAYNGETPNQFAADAYDCVYALLPFVLDGTINGDMSASEISDALMAVFATTSFDGTTGAGQTWDENGFVNKEPKVYVITDGAYAMA